MPTPRILVINPNTSADITERLKALAVEVAGEAAEIVAVTAPFGGRYISTRSAALIAGHATLDAYAAAVAAGISPDAVVVACFGDPGLAALRELAPVPVLGFAETGIKAAAAQPGRFAIATIGAAWQEMLGELVDALGLTDRLAGFIPLDGLAADPGTAAARIEQRARALSAARVIVGGTGLIPLIRQLTGITVPVIDPHRTAIRRAVALAGQAGSRAAAPAAPGSFGGLSDDLTRLLEHA